MYEGLRELLRNDSAVKAKLDSIGVRQQALIKWSFVRFVQYDKPGVYTETDLEGLRATFMITHVDSLDARDQFIIQLYGVARLRRELQPIVDNMIANLPVESK